jgi:hypothetical protein
MHFGAAARRPIISTLLGSFYDWRVNAASVSADEVLRQNASWIIHVLLGYFSVIFAAWIALIPAMLSDNVFKRRFQIRNSPFGGAPYRQDNTRNGPNRCRYRVVSARCELE